MLHTLDEVVASLTADASRIDAYLAQARARLTPLVPQLRQSVDAMASDATELLDGDEQICPELRPDPELLGQLLKTWVGRLLEPTGERSPWEETVLVGIFLSAIGARPTSFMAMNTVIGSRFVEACRTLPEAQRLDASAAFSQVLSFASIKIAACFDAVTFRSLAGVGMKECLARRLPYLATRRLVVSTTGPGRQPRGDVQRELLYEALEALEDIRDSGRRTVAELMRRASGVVEDDVVRRKIEDELPGAVRRLFSDGENVVTVVGRVPGKYGAN